MHGCVHLRLDEERVRHESRRLENLVLLCRRHHRLVHEGRVRVEVVGEGREVRFFRPDGRPIPRAPRPPRLSADRSTS